MTREPLLTPSLIAFFLLFLAGLSCIFWTGIKSTHAQQADKSEVKRELTFEHLSNQWGPRLRRAKIPGGWLVATGNDENGNVTFVSDDKHIWNGGSVP